MTTNRYSCVCLLALSVLWSGASLAQSGRGLAALAACNDQAIGYGQHLIADRLEAKLAMSAALTAPERAIWLGDIAAMRAVTPKSPQFKPYDAKDPEHFGLGLTQQELVAINSMMNRHQQEVGIQCEIDHGSMGSGPDMSYVERLRSQLITPTDVATIALAALPSPIRKTAAEIAAEQRANTAQQNEARQAVARQRAAAQAATAPGAQGAMGKAAACREESKGLRLTMMADYMQRSLDGAQGLSAKDRGDFEANIRSVREAAATGAMMPAPVDPANPVRALTRLTPQQQTEMTTEYTQRYMAAIQACTAR
jgi:hypothetical protein